MQRSGPQFAMLPPDPKTGAVLPCLPPRVKRRNPQAARDGIVDRLKRANTPEQIKMLREEADGYTNISGRTKRRVRNLS